MTIYQIYLESDDALALAKLLVGKVSSVLIRNFYSNRWAGKVLLLSHSAELEDGHLDLRKIASLV